jgi:hypothetical protein
MTFNFGNLLFWRTKHYTVENGKADGMGRPDRERISLFSSEAHLCTSPGGGERVCFELAVWVGSVPEDSMGGRGGDKPGSQEWNVGETWGPGFIFWWS